VLGPTVGSENLGQNYPVTVQANTCFDGSPLPIGLAGRLAELVIAWAPSFTDLKPRCAPFGVNGVYNHA